MFFFQRRPQGGNKCGAAYSQECVLLLQGSLFGKSGVHSRFEEDVNSEGCSHLTWYLPWGWFVSGIYKQTTHVHDAFV
jgi:hypothetical protein